MDFELLIVYEWSQGQSITEILSERLGEVLAEDQNAFDMETIVSMLSVRFERSGVAVADESGVDRERHVLASTCHRPSCFRGIWITVG